jgi:CRISPR-associated protein Csh1
MDIPQLLTQAVHESGNLLTDLVKVVSLKKSERNKDLINVILFMNLDTGLIEFQITDYQHEKSEKKYCYFGNNPSASAQFYPVRDISGLKYFFAPNSKNVFCNLLKNLPDGELKSLLQECRDAKFFDENGLNGNCLNGFNGTITLQKKEFYLNQEKITAEKLVMKWINASDNQKIMLIIPGVIKNGTSVIFSQHQDYIAFVKTSLSKSGGSHGICHICGKETDTIDTKGYSSKLSRDSISKVFVTTQTNTALNFNKNGHQRNFAICKNCYRKLFAGEKRVMSDFYMKIAGEDAITLFEGIERPLDYDEITPIKKAIDFAFQPGKGKEWLISAKDDVQDLINDGLYQFHILFYKQGRRRNSCKIRKTIEEISNTRFDMVLQAFRKISRRMFDFLSDSFTLGDVYNIVPIMKNKKGEQINVNRLLDLYSAIIKGELIESSAVFQLAEEALDKGINELQSSQLRNYVNLYHLDGYRKLNDTNPTNKRRGTDLYIRQITLRYLALFEILQELKILDKEVFQVEENAAIKGDMLEDIAEKEQYLQLHGFSETAKGLFYLGCLLYWIGEAQKRQGHTDKPILNKISYGGMTASDIVALYDDLMEKINQYSKKLSEMKVTTKVNDIISMMSKYIGNLPEQGLKMDEKAAVFYIMSGYGFSVPVYHKNNDLNNKEEKENASEQP